MRTKPKQKPIKIKCRCGHDVTIFAAGMSKYEIGIEERMDCPTCQQIKGLPREDIR